MAYPSNRPLNIIRVYAYAADISSAASAFAVAPTRGKIINMGSVRYVAITTADSAVTSKIAGTAITGGAWTLAFTSSTAGQVDEAVPTAANFVNAGDNIEFISDGGSSTTCPAMFYADIKVS